jgi:hypothetical protein
MNTPLSTLPFDYRDEAANVPQMYARQKLSAAAVSNATISLVIGPPSTPPFCNHTDEIAHVVPQMYVERQRHYISLLPSTTTPAVPLGPLCLRASVTAQVAEPDAEPTILPGAIESAKRPLTAEFLLQLCTTSIRDDSYVGCINERFGRICAEQGPARARRLYWADVLGYLLRQLPRALKLAALIGVIKRLLFG